jgi:hypothetical protein
MMMMIIITQFNSILVYLRANLTAQRPIIKLAQVHRNKQYKLANKIQNKTFYKIVITIIPGIIIIIIIIIP